MSVFRILSVLTVGVVSSFLFAGATEESSQARVLESTRTLLAAGQQVEGAPGADERTQSAASNDATLSNLSLGDEITFTPPFQARVGSYTATTAYLRSRITLRAEGPAGALIEATGETAAGTPIKPGSSFRIGSLTLDGEKKGSSARWTFKEVPVGRNTITVKVTSEDRKATQIYTVTVVRRDPDMDIEEERDLYFFESVKDGNADGVTSAIEAGVDVTKQLESGRQRISAVALASANGYEEVVRILIRAGADVNEAVPASIRGSAAGRFPLILAVNKQSEEIVRILIRAGADVNQVVPASIRGSTAGLSPLILAVNKQSETMVRLLIEAGADVNYQAPGKRRRAFRTALGMAKAQKNKRIVKLLRDAGAKKR